MATVDKKGKGSGADNKLCWRNVQFTIYNTTTLLGYDEDTMTYLIFVDQVSDSSTCHLIRGYCEFKPHLTFGEVKRLLRAESFLAMNKRECTQLEAINYVKRQEIVEPGMALHEYGMPKPYAGSLIINPGDAMVLDQSGRFNSTGTYGPCEYCANKRNLAQIYLDSILELELKCNMGECVHK